MLRLAQHALIVSVAALLACAALAPSAQAEAPEIEVNYSAGKSALKAGKLDEALTRFKAALSFSKGDEGRTWQMLLAIALTYKERNEPQHAIEYYRRFLKQTEGQMELMPVKWKRRRGMATNDLTELERAIESSHGFVAISTEPPGATILVNGAQGGADGDAVSPFGLILPAGEHTIRITLEGHEPFEKLLSVRPGGAHPIKVSLERPKPSSPAPALEVSAPPPAGTSPSAVEGALSERTQVGEAAPPLGPWLTIGTAGAMALSAAALSVLASEENKTIETINSTGDPNNASDGAALAQQWKDANDALNTYQTTAGVLYGLSLAAAAGGIVWMLLSEPDEGDASVALTPTSGGAYGVASWSF